jgi:hypothetical protein
MNHQDTKTPRKAKAIPFAILGVLVVFGFLSPGSSA